MIGHLKAVLGRRDRDRGGVTSITSWDLAQWLEALTQGSRMRNQEPSGMEGFKTAHPRLRSEEPPRAHA
jgi:hypothetical protein